ncbi:MAG: glycosyltransferase family 2 protein [Planktomarina sp.]
MPETNVLTDIKTRTSPHGRVMAVSMMKDEAPFLLEWVAHHLAVGFTDILVYTNECSDGTVEMLQRLETLGLGYHRENIIPEGIKPQPSALKHAQVEPLVQTADWVMVFDADEFLVLRHPSGHLDGMISDAVAQDANGIVVTWRIFGSNDVVDWSRDPVSEQYTRAAPPLWNKGWGVKTLFKFDPDYWKLGIHRPSIKNKHLETGYPDTIKWLNGSGRPMEEWFKFRGWRSIRRTLGYDWAQMNHYAVKSVDSYAVRKFRGNVNNKADKYNSDYWSLQDRNEIEDISILRHADRRAAIMAALLEDPVLNDLHHKALLRVEARLDAYRQTPAYAQLKSDLITASKVSIRDVEAKPSKARDPAKIAALMSKVEKQANDKPVSEYHNDTVDDWPGKDGSPYVDGKIDLSGPVNVTWTPNHDIQLPTDTRVFNPEALNAIVAGRFDRRNARNIERYVDGFTRLLDLGTGVGFIPMRLRLVMPGLTILAQDNRRPLIRMGRNIADHNGRGIKDTTRLKLVDTELQFQTDTHTQASGLAAYLKDFHPDVVRIARPAAVTEKMLTDMPLDGVQRIIIPFESGAEATFLSDAYAPVLVSHGFAKTPDRDMSGSLQFDRRVRV